MNFIRPIEKTRDFIDAYATPLSAAGGVTASYIGLQIIRLIGSIFLARLLAPQLLGTMLLINTLRTGGELLTDVSIGQGIIQNPRGGEPVFYNTAWTIQAMRGFVLFAIALIACVPLAKLYQNPQLMALLPAAALVFMLSGFVSPGRFILMKRMEVNRLALFDLIVAVISSVIQIVLAYVLRNIWALILGLLIGQMLSTIGSFLLVRGLEHRLQLDRAAARQVGSFGKWIFGSSIVYFLSMNFDRLYLAHAIPFAILGIYGIARTYSDSVMQLYQKLGGYILFPKIAAVRGKGASVRFALAPVRPWLLVAIALPLAGGVALADQLVAVLYDHRYEKAGIFLTVLLFGSWFGTLAIIADSILTGVGKPAGIAISNGIKFAFIFALVPIALLRYGLLAAIAVMIGADLLRYVALSFNKWRNGVSFIRQDIAFTLIFVAMCVTFRALSGLASLTSGVNGWIYQLSVGALS